MKQFYFFSIAIVFLLLSQNSWGQVKLGDNPENIDPAALLELESTIKGLLLPRMTSAQRDALPTGISTSLNDRFSYNPLLTCTKST